MNKIKQRQEKGAICPVCKSPDWIYLGRCWEPDGKHRFSCKSCGNNFQYGRANSIYLELI